MVTHRDSHHGTAMLARILPTINIYCTMTICTIRSLEDT